MKLRRPFLPVYATLPVQALNLCAALFRAISNKVAKLGTNDGAARNSWEVVQNAILSGVLVRGLPDHLLRTPTESAQDYMETNDDG